MLKNFTQDDIKNFNFIKKSGEYRKDNFNVEKNELINILTYSEYFAQVVSLIDKSTYSFDYAEKIKLKNILLCWDSPEYTCFLIKIDFNIYQEKEKLHLGLIEKSSKEHFFAQKEFFSSTNIEHFLILEENVKMKEFKPIIEKYLLENNISIKSPKVNKFKI